MHLGDLMSTDTRASFASLPAKFSPLERLLLTANGNLQRLISSYYNAPVTVTIVRNNQIDAGLFDREVVLRVFGLEFCRATSKVVITEPELQEAVAGGKVGLGQLFRAFNILPTFELLDARRQGGVTEKVVDGGGSAAVDGEQEKGGVVRTYKLTGGGVECTITEAFVPDVFGLTERPCVRHEAEASSNNNNAAAAAGAEAAG